MSSCVGSCLCYIVVVGVCGVVAAWDKAGQSDLEQSSLGKRQGLGEPVAVAWEPGQGG